MSEVPDQQNNEPIAWATFLEQTPPGVFTAVSTAFDKKGDSLYLATPDIQLFCNSGSCEGMRFFSHANEAPLVYGSRNSFFLTYTCRNCQQTSKTFAVRVTQSGSSRLYDKALKFGELPAFGPPTPSRVISLIGPDRDIFLRGRRAENQGLGIGAFAYYRRVVENQKGRLLNEIIKVAKRLNAAPETITALEKAATETQFSRAVDDVKTAIPQVLLINGHNPLVLLHSALSEGLHAGTDEECLELATSIRLVLTELAERISQALKNEAELNQAVTRLMKPKQR